MHSYSWDIDTYSISTALKTTGNHFPSLRVFAGKAKFWASSCRQNGPRQLAPMRMPFFLFSLRRRTRLPFSSKSFCSCAGEFGRHFVCGKSLHGTVFFPTAKNFFTKKNFFEDFFPQVGKPSTEISRENKNCGFPQKCGRLEALICVLFYQNIK